MSELVPKFVMELHRWSLSGCDKAFKLLPNRQNTDVRPTMFHCLEEIVESAVKLWRNTSRVKIQY
jgi:hypothetical protein